MVSFGRSSNNQLRRIGVRNQQPDGVADIAAFVIPSL
jgi:hypothetical protein